MTYELYRTLFIVCAISAGIMFVLSTVLFFVLKIPSIIGYLTGKTAQHSADKLKKQTTNEAPSTLKSPKKEGLIKTSELTGSAGTTLLSNNATTVLNDTNGTTLLSNNATTVLNDTNGTTLLNDNSMLSEKLQSVKPAAKLSEDNKFSVASNITFIHTDEIIR